MIPQDKVTLENHSNIYHPSERHTGHHRKPSPSPDHSSLKEVVAQSERVPLSVFTHQRRPSASPDPNQLRTIVQSSPVQQDRIPLHRKPSPVSFQTSSNVFSHDMTTFVPAEPVHKKPIATVDHSSMKSLVSQSPVENSVRRVRASPGGTDHIILG